ncbi:MAG: MucR family transcriptional regulator, partial [Microvirga sp.]
MAKAMQAGSTGVLELTSDIVASYVSNNSVPQGDLAGLINSVRAALSGTMNGTGATEETQALKPPVPI